MRTKRTRELEQLIAHHKAAYYQGRPEISDEAYDKLEDELRRLDPKNPILELVGTSVDLSSEKVSHAKKMLSLEKTYDPKDLAEFLKHGSLVSIFKIDGSSCSLVYEKGILVVAKTRGDGSQGENITKKVAYIGDIPKTLTRPVDVEVRGEVFCRTQGFHKIATEMAAAGLEAPTSQRNIVAGLLGRKEHITFAQHLSFQGFDLLGAEAATEVEKLKLLSELGFSVPDWELHEKVDTLTERIEATKAFMETGDYLIDGLVFIINETRIHDELGETSHHPRYKLAFKFQGETRETTIDSITWQVSRNGRLTPVAEITPTELSGALISRVTLHNLGVVRDFTLKAGDRIEIVRSGEVIPKFLSVKESARGTPQIPDRCPSCDQRLSVEDIWLLCTNTECGGRRLETILHWIQKVNIEDLSEKRLQEMIAKGLVKDIPDLYRLSVEDLLTLEKVKEKLATKIHENIQKTKRLDLSVLMAGLGVEGVSTAKAEKIIAHGHNTIELLMELDVEKLVAIEGFASKSATDIVRSLASKADVLHALLELGFHVNAPEVVKGGRLEGAKICITGTLSAPRADVEKTIKQNGGAVVGSVSKNTTYLLTNDTDPASSKYKKALELKTTIITEEEFFKLIEG